MPSDKNTSDQANTPEDFARIFHELSFDVIAWAGIVYAKYIKEEEPPDEHLSMLDLGYTIYQRFKETALLWYKNETRFDEQEKRIALMIPRIRAVLLGALIMNGSRPPVSLMLGTDGFKQFLLAEFGQEGGREK